MSHVEYETQKALAKEEMARQRELAKEAVYEVIEDE